MQVQYEVNWGLKVLRKYVLKKFRLNLFKARLEVKFLCLARRNLIKMLGAYNAAFGESSVCGRFRWVTIELHIRNHYRELLNKVSSRNNGPITLPPLAEIVCMSRFSFLSHWIQNLLPPACNWFNLPPQFSQIKTCKVNYLGPPASGQVPAGSFCGFLKPILKFLLFCE